MLEIDNIGAAIVKGICNPEAKDLAVDLGQFEIGALLDEEILKEIPIIKSIIACHKTWEAVHDQLFLRKVATFISASPKFTQEQVESFMQENLHNGQQVKRLSDAIVLILDKLDDMEKPMMLAKIFAAFVRNEIGLDVFRRLSTAIGVGFLDDLKELSKISDNPSQSATWRSSPQLTLYVNLLHTGLTGPKRSSGTVPITGVSYEITELGRTFVKCMNV